MIARTISLSSLSPISWLPLLAVTIIVSPSPCVLPEISFHNSIQTTTESSNQPSQPINNNDSPKRPPSANDLEPRDESGLPDDAFNPMKLYEGDAEEVGPTIIPGEDGIVHWPYLTVHVKEKYIDIEGVIGINDGYLEQVVCTPGTRGYESLIIAFAQPSHIHAALLLLGLEPGKPGRWEAITPDKDHPKTTYKVVQPKGDKVRVTVLYEKQLPTPDQAEYEPPTPSDSAPSMTDNHQMENNLPKQTLKEKSKNNPESSTVPPATIVEVPIQDWIIDINTGKRFPNGSWIFGGSRMKKDFTDHDRYVADLSGSIVGLVTFGDETLGWNEVWPDEEEVRAPEWVCNTKVMPAWNTKVTLRLRPLEPGE